MDKKRATMKDVAKLAGVTQPTVSYVINKTANISLEVTERLNQAIKELKYEPNYSAVALKTNRTRMIGVIIPDISNEYYAKLVNIVVSLLAENGYTLMIHSTSYCEDIEEQCVKSQLTYNVDGFIVMYQMRSQVCLDMLRDSGKKVVILEGGTQYKNISYINTDNLYGGYTATKYLLDQGRKNIVYIDQYDSLIALNARRDGYIKAMKEAGLYRKDLIFSTSKPGDKWEEGILLGRQLLLHDIDGIIVSSDIIAIGILKTFLMAGKKIPEEVALVGYDDVPLARLFMPALTTMEQPVEAMCKLAVQRIIGEKETGNKVFKPHLIIRETA